MDTNEKPFASRLIARINFKKIGCDSDQLRGVKRILGGGFYKLRGYFEIKLSITKTPNYHRLQGFI